MPIFEAFAFGGGPKGGDPRPPIMLTFRDIPGAMLSAGDGERKNESAEGPGIDI